MEIKALLCDKAIPTAVFQEILGELAEKYKDFSIIYNLSVVRPIVSVTFADMHLDVSQGNFHLIILPKEMSVEEINKLFKGMPENPNVHIFRWWEVDGASGAMEVTKANIKYLRF